jgi:uncharacterized delta-60 repeat protein
MEDCVNFRKLGSQVLIASALVVSYAASVSAGGLVARLNTDGTLDASFNAGGKLKSTDSSQVWTGRAGPFGGGKFILGGYITQSDSTMTGIISKFNNDGSGDASFGFFGVIPVDFSTSTQEYVIGVDVQSSLKIIAVGVVFDSTHQWLTVWRINANGTADTTFGTSGVTRVLLPASGGAVYPEDVFIQGDDKIVVAGYHVVGSTQRMAVTRFTANGAVDTAFGSSGTTDVSFGSGGSFGLGVSSDGSNIVVAGYISGASTTTSMGAARFTSTGALDTTWGSGGKRFIDYAGTTNEVANDVMCWPGQGCFVYGDFDEFSSTNNKFALAKLDSSGNVAWQTSTSFSGTNVRAGGRIAMNTFNNSNDLRVAASGVVDVSGLGQLAVARWLSNGVLDTTFGATTGKVTVGVTGTDVNLVKSLLMDQSTNKLIPAGSQ